MQQIKDILTLERTLFSMGTHSKKKTFELIADTIAFTTPSLRTHDIFDALVARERLGSTHVGHGVAIPHARLDQAEQPLGCFILLKKSIDFDAQDHTPVDMVFALIVPMEAKEEHLELLAEIAVLFHKEEFCSYIRQTTSRLELYQRLIGA